MLKYLFSKEDDIPQGTAAIFFGISSIAWFVIGTGLGSFNAAKLAFPDLFHGLYSLQFGHMRQVHVHAVIFGWIAMAFAASMMYITPALGNTKLWSEKLGVWNCLLYNVGLCLALALLWSGVTSGREYSDHIWPIDLYIAFVMVVPWSLNVWMTIVNRRTQGIYTTNWFFAGCMFMTIIVFLIGNTPEWLHLTGLNEAYMTWWFAHNILGLLITPVAAAITYYIVPKITGNPLYSHRVGHLHFWSIVVFYSTPAAHHLMSSPLPEWLKSFASVEGVLILVPAVAYVCNILLTMQGRWALFVENIEIKFTITGVLLAIPLNMQGGFQQTRAINWYIHGTGWIVAHAHLALLGFSTFAEAASVYYGMQVLLRRKLWSASLANFHFWMLLIGFSLYWTSMTISGLIQGAAKIYEVPYVDVVIAEHPYMIVRWLGGTMVFFGNIIWLYNMIMTARAGDPVPVGRQPAEIAYTR
ncbi:MAG: cytochrome-c oxidase [Zetaproteobacteria bacterium CG12_big_fil_rev_8_21_14_0_65_55_1124]|nr:MAG: cytochrome-c oxidase [Zetaproteobacteria bacterium CG1_02_55_237]PIS20325.1 MAG: cytochrome-c oxidase [Zetaproteobacteria bacterium CG08_land_8_20_14_0_20_55_17]PIW42448.1 MAG: cytochrome-c oxidase [Zetaproteobacteria bacterium CG12_big_fil_rev_8_21_14_0_65_55_1124]PIY52327.1 MAG: cytochrome-c oxidase [Zetaproteobacteria bacterium CG_4_10_14_0_8_um_filter_55_43]PIZ37106.1 MAG: cytochrome-c oxidase [Zetaproteobacteria bacterium CG_4_10_14_0_2_um_filter_55_20]PJB81806.1 MAG: cytochrome-c